MQSWLIPLLSIVVLASAGVFMPLYYLRQSHRRYQSQGPWFAQSESLLVILAVLALLSVGLFIFVVLFSF